MDVSMLNMFRSEVGQQSTILNAALQAMSEKDLSSEIYGSAIKATHSIRGAARLMEISPVSHIAEVMEECFIAAQDGHLIFTDDAITELVAATEMISTITAVANEFSVWQSDNAVQFDTLVDSLKSILESGKVASQDNFEAAALVVADTPETPTSASVKKKGGDLSLNIQDMSMVDLFRMETDQQSVVLNEGLLELEQDPGSPERLEPLMRAAHSIKGAARLVDIQFVVQLAHVMEDVFVEAQKGSLIIQASHIDVLLNGVDTIVEISKFDGVLNQWMDLAKERFDNLIHNLNAILKGEGLTTVPVNNSAEKKEKLPAASPLALPDESKDGAVPVINAPDKLPLQNKERVLRVSADQLNRLMGLAGESLVESRWIYPYAESLLRLKRQQTDLVCLVDSLREQVDSGGSCDDIQALVRSVQKQSSYCREILADRLAELESYDRRATNLSSRLHREVVKSRMRPFGDGIHGFPRMVRDVARGLGKEVQFVVDGAKTLVDRDILDKMESPLNHLIRNAIDHGMESPEERQASGKTTKGSIRLHAYHHAGMLSIVVEDNGRGVDLERLRRKVIEKGLVDEVMATTLSDSELLEFLFLPSFSTREQVSEISGRGVGLDVVHDVVQEMRGNVRAVSEFGKGTKFHMQLPLTLSVIPALIVEIAEESYAFPLARIDRIVRIDPDSIEEAEGNQFVRIDNMNVGLVNAAQILEREPRRDHDGGLLSVVVLTERASHYGMVVEKFLGERELVVQVMPAALGKVQDISAAALMEDGSPVLIVDVDDLIRSIEKVLKVARLSKIRDIVQTLGVAKRVLVVDDSITVREVERKLLEASGYAVDTAVDGVDGLNMLRGGGYDLLITDVDMPRMNGIDLVKTVRQDPGLRSLPVMMVSYKDREEDRIRGLDAGADYYLTKGSFHDESLRQAVIDLIGMASV